MRIFKLPALRILALLSVLSITSVADAQKGKKPPPETETKTEELNLAVGENKTIPASDVKNYSEGTPGIVDVKLTSDSSQFVIVGLKAGSTSLLLIKKAGVEVNWIINVFARSPTRRRSGCAQRR